MKKNKPFGELFYRSLKKTLLIMRIATILLILGILQAHATDAYSQKTRLSLNFSDTELIKVLDNIEVESEFFFLFNEKLLDTDRKVNITANDQLINVILDNLFAGTDVKYSIIDRKIILAPEYLTEDVPLQQQITITGTVTDKDGQPLPGVTIVVKGTTTGTITNTNGSFTLTVPSKAESLQFSFVGMKTQEVPIEGRTIFTVVMEEEIIGLEEVIAVGYRTQTRGTVTGSISTVVSDQLQDIPMDNLSNALAGRLSGVTITQVAGTPGQESNIQVRTRGTLNDTDPLYVIDGIVASKYAFDALSTDEVDNITLLKDAASAAIYGSRGANGVILVTTKRGSNRPPTISYNGTVGVQTPTRIPDALNAYEHALLINDGVAYQRYYEQDFQVDPDDPLIYTQDELDYFKKHTYNWIEELWRDPITTQHTLSASGGSENVNYYIGGTYNYAIASFDNVDFNKLSLRANIDVKLAQGLTASLDLHTDNRTTHGPNWDTGNWRFEDLYKAMTLRTQLVPPSINGESVGNWVEWSPDAVINLNAGYQNRKWSGTTATMSLDYKIPFIDGLSVNVKYNRYQLDEEIKRFSQPYWMTMFATTGTHS